MGIESVGVGNRIQEDGVALNLQRRRFAAH
jgi:hypothetical protein